jgi:hypothetical protein
MVLDRIEGYKTFIYLVAFDVTDMSNKEYILSNNRLNLKGTLVSDDISIRNNYKKDNSLDYLIENQLKDNEYERRYFPNNIGGLVNSIPLTTSICLGWSDYSYDFKDGAEWICTFRDLTSEGRKLYYSIKKLHNNKEVRILTFNNI